MKKIETVPCYDCGKPIKITNGKIEGKMLVREGIARFKCLDCFKIDPRWLDHPPIEVYSRVVGYLRPVSQWHVGKQEEYRQRKNFKMV